jgi:vitamin B12 transporter
LRIQPFYIALFSLIAPILVLVATPVMGAEVNEVAKSLGLSDDEQITGSYFPRPASKIAENVTVITADDISRINAHTLAEVLQTVPGIQLDQLQTPGSWVFFNILGLTSRHILVQIDGIPQNFISADNQSEVGSIPVQMIERVEIVKGAASAAWGSAMGGVINIISKSPPADRPVSGMASASIGERYTSDLRAELSGTSRNLGYYLTGGNIFSRGLTPGNGVNLSHGFGKFIYNLPEQGNLTLGLDVRQSTRGLEDFAALDFHDSGGIHYFNSYLALHYPLAERLTLEANAHGGSREMKTKWGELSGPTLFQDYTTREIYQGAKLGINWGDAEVNLSAGAEYEQNDISQRETISLAPENNFDLSFVRLSTYLSGTYTIGALSILPGVRLDHTNLLEDALSYTLGATLRLTDSTTLRAYAARGYSMPQINDLAILNGRRQLQNIQTVQAGIETAAIPYLWLKGTLFYNNIWKIQNFDSSTTPATVTLHDQVRQGVDLEGRTTPLLGFALTGGFTYTDAWDKQTKTELTSEENGPSQNFKVGLLYDNAPLGLRGAFNGNYAIWNFPEGSSGKSSPVWDLHLTQKLFLGEDFIPELFFSAHNIFNGAQYLTDVRPNAPRWFEGGARFRF